MARMRISTTVDATSWSRARELLGLPGSRIVDRALKALIEELDEEREAAALKANPYDQDSNLSWESTEMPDLPYDGEVPTEVLELARRRRRTTRS